MQTKDILALESAEAGAIILHKEGLFWRAYQYSAFLFAIHIRSLKVNTKFVKAVNTEIAYLGFPEKVLEAVLQQAAERQWKVEREGKQISITIGEVFSPEAFQSWFLTHQGSTNKPAQAEALEKNSSVEAVLRKLRSYPILEKSPLETQQFVLNLQKEINGLV